MIHAPEGSWVTWPWAYDAAMAMLATLAMQLHASDPMTALAWVAPCWGLVNTALVIGITRRLRFPLLFQVVALACFATSPLTQLLHRVGMLDHHFVEYSFVLAILYLGLGWAQHPCRVRWATALGLALGAVAGDCRTGGRMAIENSSTRRTHGLRFRQRVAGVDGGLFAAVLGVSKRSFRLHAALVVSRLHRGNYDLNRGVLRAGVVNAQGLRDPGCDWRSRPAAHCAADRSGRGFCHRGDPGPRAHGRSYRPLGVVREWPLKGDRRLIFVPLVHCAVGDRGADLCRV